jgi:hypothetical protein
VDFANHRQAVIVLEVNSNLKEENMVTMDRIFERFLKKSPVSVMVRATLENVFSPERLDELFAQNAKKQRPGQLLFSTVVDSMSLVVCKIRPSLHAVYQARKKKFGVSVKSLYNKINGVEPAVSEALVRQTAADLREIVQACGAVRRPVLPGYRTLIVDGNHFPGVEHRIEELRTTRSGALPGQALAVLEAETGLVVDAIGCEDGHSQERSLLPELVQRFSPGDVVVADRNFCTTNFLFDLSTQKAFFVIRQHGSTLTWQPTGRRRRVGKCGKDVIYEQIVKLTDPRRDETMYARRITIKLHQPTRDGDWEVHVLTNLPKKITAQRVADVYGKRWSIESAFGELATVLNSEIETLGHPPAAVLGFCVALVAYNQLMVVKAALRAVHGEETVDSQVSSYYLADEIAGTWRGLTIAVEEATWSHRFSGATASQMARFLLRAAKLVDLSAFQKHPRGPKKPRPRRTSGKKQKHVSIARILAKRKLAVC